MIVASILFCLSSFALATTMIATRIKLSQAWGQTNTQMAWAVGVAAAPTLVGLLLLPVFLLGLWSPLACLLLPFVLVVIIGWNGLQILVADTRTFRTHIRESAFPTLIPVVMTTGFAVYMLVLLSMPVVENDALEYAAVARFIGEQGSLSRYPLVIADQVSGLYAPSLHPPLFHLLLIYSGVFSGEESLVGQRLIAGWSHIGLLFVVWALARKISREVALFSVALLFCTPFLNSSMLAFGIEPLRIAALMAAVAGVIIALEMPETRSVIAAGLFTALAMWTHSIGILMPLFGVVILAFHLPKQKRWSLVALYISVAAVVGGGWYVQNLIFHGVLISDSWPATTWPNLHYADDLAARRGLLSFGERLLNGVLRPWTALALYGLAFWLATGSLFLKHHYKDRYIVSSGLIMIGIFGVLAFISSTFGSDLMVKNPRYWLTMTPVAAICGAVWLTSIFQKAGLWRHGTSVLLGILAIWTGIALVINTYGFVSPLAAVVAGESKFLEQKRFTGGPLLAALNTPEQGRVLSFRSSDTAVYVRRPQIAHFDPALKLVHEGTVENAATWLRTHDARWAYLPDYSPVSHSYSALGAMLADPRYAEPVASHRNAKLFRLIKSDATTHCQKIETGPSQVHRLKTGLGSLLAGMTGIPHLARIIPATSEQNEGAELIWSAKQTGEIILPLLEPLEGRFTVNLSLSGNGIAAISAAMSKASNIRLIDGLVMNRPHIFAAQWNTEPGQFIESIRITPVSPAQGNVQVLAAEICKIAIIRE